MPTPIYYPPEENGLQKLLDSDLNTGVTASLTLNNTNKIQNKPGVLVVDRIDTNGALLPAADREYIVYTGVSGSTLTGLTRGLGGSTDQDHSVGAVVEFVPDVVVFQMIMDALATLVSTSDVTSINTTNIVTPTGTQTLTNKTLTKPIVVGGRGVWVAATDGATVTFDLDNGNKQNVTLGGNRTLALSNVGAGQVFILKLIQDGTGSRTVTWFSTINWVDGTAPTLTPTADKADVFGFIQTATDTYDGFIIGQNI